MSSRTKISQFAQILAIKNIQVSDAKVQLERGQYYAKASDASELEAREDLAVSVDLWHEHLNSAAPDPMVLGFQGLQITALDHHHKQAVESAQQAHRGVEKLSLAYCTRIVEAQHSSKQLSKAKAKQTKYDNEKTMSRFEDRTTFVMAAM
jgi:hypothetical protein